MPTSQFCEELNMNKRGNSGYITGFILLIIGFFISVVGFLIKCVIPSNTQNSFYDFSSVSSCLFSPDTLIMIVIGIVIGTIGAIIIKNSNQ